MANLEDAKVDVQRIIETGKIDDPQKFNRLLAFLNYHSKNNQTAAELFKQLQAFNNEPSSPKICSVTLGKLVITGQSRFLVNIVGESHYQDNLKQICSSKTKDGLAAKTIAKLILDDNNPYDNKAVKVEILGKTVGYLSREEAPHYREHLTAYGYTGMTAFCEATITGGFGRGEDDVGSYGVRLDIPIEFVESPNAPNPSIFEERQDAGTNEFIFYVDRVQSGDIKQCHIGDGVGLWAPKPNASEVYIYRSGSLGGTGKIGYVPRKYSSIVIKHLSHNLDYETEILEISSSICKIRCKLFSQEETSARLAKIAEDYATSLRVELQKVYSPRKSLSTVIQLTKSNTPIIGDELSLEKQPLEFYIHMAPNLQINLINNNGVIVAKKNSDVSSIRSILKAFFNKYHVKFRITSIEPPNSYLDYIEAKTEVTFDKIDPSPNY